MSNKLKCYECGEEHKARGDKFPKKLVTLVTVPIPKKNLEDTQEYRQEPKLVGYVCFKCLRKVNLSQLKKTIRKEFQLKDNEVVTRHHIQKFFKKDEIPFKMKEEKDEKERVNTKNGRAGTKHLGLLHNLRQTRSFTLLSKACKRFFIPKDRKGK